MTRWPTFLIADIDECADGEICGEGAICTNSPGSFSCSCPKGTAPEPDPFTKCIQVVSCKSDNDCPGNAICDQQQRCFCPEPNVGNDCRRKFKQSAPENSFTIWMFDVIVSTNVRTFLSLHRSLRDGLLRS